MDSMNLLRQRSPLIAEQWYQAIVHTGFVPLALHQVRQRISELTDQVITLLGTAPLAQDEARWVGISLVRLGYLQPEALAGTQEVLARQLLEGLPADLAAEWQPRVAELLGRVASGYMQATLDEMLNRQEQIHGALIAERQRAERSLRESEYRYRTVSELASDYAYALRVEPDGSVVREWITQAFARITGYTPEELDTRGGLHHIVYPEDASTVLQHTNSLLAGQTSVCEYRIVTKSGEVRWLRDHGRAECQAQWEAGSDQLPSVKADGRVVRIIGATRDITERKQAEEALKASETRYRSLVETSPDSIILTDLDANFIVCNRQTARMHGYDSSEEMRGMNAAQLIAPHDLPDMLQNVRLALETGLASNLEYTLLRKDGSSFQGEFSASLVRDGDGKPQAFIAVVRDITQRKRTEQAEREQRVLAEALRDTAAVLTSTLELDKVLDYILSDVERVVPHNTANIMLVDSSGHVARVVRTKGFADPALESVVRAREYPLADYASLRRMTDTGQALVVVDTQSKADWVVFPETSWIHSYVGAPIRQRGQLLGFLNLNSDQPGFFTLAHAERLQAFADQAAMALANARLYESARRNVERLTLLREAGQSLALAGSLDELYREIVRRAVQFVNANTSNLALFDGAEHLVSVAVENLPDEIVGTRVKLGEGLNGRAAQSRQPQFVSNYARLDRKQRASVADGLPFVALAVLPLVWQERLVGTLSVADNRERDLGEDDVHLLNSFAALVAAALEQRRAVAEMQARETEAHTLTARLAHIREEERARIAAQLHASIGHRLSALEQGIERIQAHGVSDEWLSHRLTSSLALLKETQQMVDSLALDLDSKQLDDLGLDLAARQVVERLCEVDCPISLRVSGHIRRLDPEIERIAYRTLQEALTNAVRRAQATRIMAHVHFALKSLRLNVQDNGQGFDPALIEHGNGMGLADLRRQAQVLGGNLVIESTLAEGTLVTLSLPFKASTQDQPQIPVLLVAGQQLIRQGLRMALAESDELTCVGEVADSAAAVRQIELSHPDLVLMDVRLSGPSGIETTRQIVKRFPQVRVIVFSYLPDETYMEQAFQAGAKGFAVLSDDSHAMVDVLHGVLSGKSLVSPSLAEAWARFNARTTVVDTGNLVTARERQVLNMIAAGYSNQAIGDEMGISKRTVEVHRRNLKAKLKTKNSAQMIQSALRLGLITLKP